MIDHDTIAELRDMVGTKFKLIIQTYLDNGDEFIGRISDGISNDDKSGIARAAHAFKSASGQVGALALETYLSDLEENTEAKDIRYSQNIFEKTKNEYYVVRQELSDIII